MRFSLRLSLLCGFTALTILAASPKAQAQTTAASFTGGTLLAANGTVAGWRFTLASPVTVTSLGFFDEGGNGLSVAHQVGIYNTGTQALLVSATVASGTTDPLLSGFRYNSTLTGTTTLATGDYVIAAEGDSSGLDRFMGFIPSGNLTMAGGVTYIENRFAFNTGLAFPSATAPSQERGYFGPNFQFTATVGTAPEPGTLALVALGGGLVLVKRRRNSPQP